MTENIMIIGGHGKVALRAEPLLADAGHHVTAMIRNPQQQEDVKAAGATPLVLDIEHATREQLVDAFTGMDAIVWSAGAGGGTTAERTHAVDRDAAILSMQAAAEAGVKRYVMVSYDRAKLDHGVPEDDSFFAYAEAKAHADEHLRTSDLDWTILGPGTLTLDDPSGRITLRKEGEEVTGDRRTARGNVARAIVAALELDSTIGRKLDFADGEKPIREAFSA